MLALCLLLSLASPAPAAQPAAADPVQQLIPGEDPFAFPAPAPRARQGFGYASPWTLLLLAAGLTLLAALIGKYDPRKRKRIKRATILFMLYLTTFLLAAILGIAHAEGWSRRVWFLADLFEVLVVIDFVAILLFDLVLLALRIEIANIVHDLALGAAYILGGIALQLDDSIHLGDWLQLPNGQQGKVKAIRWRHTVVETRNWDTVIVPN